MATRRGPKVEPHENPIIEKQVFEEPQEKLMSEEEVIAQEEFINEPAETPEEIKESLEKFHNVDGEAEIKELVDAETDAKIEEAVEEFKKIPDVPIITAPAPPKRKTLAQLTACELNIYHKTGILPLL
jgi:hypothetical protein